MNSNDDYHYVELTVPPVFWQDHLSRELVLHTPLEYDRGRDRYSCEVKSTKSAVTVRLHKRDAFDLWDDANHYRQETEYPLGLVRSAQYTFDRINRAFTESEIQTWKHAGTCALHEASERCPLCGDVPAHPSGVV